MSDSVGSVSVDVVPDARGWAEKLRAQIRDQTVVVKVKADTAEAEAEIDKVARDRRSTVKVNVDKSQIEQGAKSLDSFIGKLGLLPALALTAGSALIPLVGVAGGLSAALFAPLAIAGGGATLFAFLGGLAAKDTEKQLKNIDQLQKKLAGLTKGTAEYAQTQQELKAAQAALTPEQVKFAKAQDTLSGSFQKFLAGKGGQTLLLVMAQGMTVLAHVLPTATPLIEAVGHSLGILLGDLDHAAQSDSFAHFIGQVAKLAGRDIVIGGRILGDLAQGAGSLIFQLDKHLSGDVLRGIERLSSSFSDWATSKRGRDEVHGFIAYFHDNGPQVAHTIGAVARGIGHIVEALAPLGPPVLHIIEGIANALGGIPIPVLTALAGATGGLVALQKLGGLKLIGAAAGATLNGGGAKGALTGLLTGGVQKVFVVNMPPGGLGGGIAGDAEKGGVLGWLKKGLPALGGLTPGGAGAFALAGAGVGFLANKGYSLTHQNAIFGDRLPIGLGGHDQPSVPQSPHLTSTTNAFDALRARAQSASRTIDQIGPHADAAFGQASRDVDTFAGKLAAIHDKRLAIILQDQAAVRTLERLQAWRLADKNFNIYAHYQQVERAPGPGGGMGQNPHGSGGGNGGGAGRVPVHIHLDQNGRTTLSGFMDGRAQGVYDDNRAYERDHG